jgi:hypothetical protein
VFAAYLKWLLQMFYHYMQKNKIVKEPDKEKFMCISLESSNHTDLELLYK